MALFSLFLAPINLKNLFYKWTELHHPKGMEVNKRTYFFIEIKPCRFGSRIQDAEAFWYKTEIKIIYFVPLCLNVLIVFDCMVYPDPK